MEFLSPVAHVSLGERIPVILLHDKQSFILISQNHSMVNVLNAFILLFSNKMLVIRAEMHLSTCHDIMLYDTGCV